MSWYSHNFIAVDTETTGLDWFEDRVIQVGISEFGDGVCRGVHEYIVDSGKKSSPEALATHGITDEMQRLDGYSPRHAFFVVAEYLRLTGFAVIMNAPFDLNFLIEEWKRYNIYFEIPYIIDPLVISRFYEKNRIPSLAKGRRTLKSLSERYGINDYPLHSAGHDSRRVGELAIQMGQRHGQFGRSPISELDKKQRKWHRNWCDDFASYADSKGFFFQSTEWPHRKGTECPDLSSARLPLE